MLGRVGARGASRRGPFQQAIPPAGPFRRRPFTTSSPNRSEYARNLAGDGSGRAVGASRDITAGPCGTPAAEALMFAKLVGYTFRLRQHC